MVLSDIAPFRLIDIDINKIYNGDIRQLMQFGINEQNKERINTRVGVIDILCDSNNKVYVQHGDFLYRTSRPNCSIYLIMHKLYPGKQIETNITYTQSTISNEFGINACNEMITDKKFIPDFIEALGDGVCQGDIQLH